MKTFTLLGLSLLVAGAQPSFAQERDSLDVQKARTVSVTSHGKMIYYTKKFDLSGLPSYQPNQKVSGTIRIWGNNYLGDSYVASNWEKGFKKFHPDANFEYNLKSGLIATAGLVAGTADLAGNRRITFAEVESFERMFNYHPTEIAMARGSLDAPGWMTTFCIVVNKDNPLTKLTMKQLDGIFGAERDGGWEFTTWHPEAARSAKENIRTWGQLGLTGEWANKPIHVYGLNLRYNNCDMFEHVVFQGGDKWNEKLREYANYARPDGTLAIGAAELAKDLGHDKYGIGWSGIQNLTPETKAMALAVSDDAAPIPLTLDTVHDRSYPLAFDMYFYINRKPGTPIDPKVKEFLRYVLSREGQEVIMADGKYLPLTAEFVREQLAKLD